MVEVIFFREEGGRVGIDVRDSGIGIPDDARAQLFSEFFRASNAKEMEEIGTGLGLAIVKEYVQLHGGSIHVESQLGKGSVFHVLLPMRGGEMNENSHCGFLIQLEQVKTIRYRFRCRYRQRNRHRDQSKNGVTKMNTARASDWMNGVIK